MFLTKPQRCSLSLLTVPKTDKENFSVFSLSSFIIYFLIILKCYLNLIPFKIIRF